MLEFYIAGQSMKMYSPVIAADSLNYLTARFHFTGSEWEGYTRWAHFRKGETVYDLALDENNTITEDKALNLTIGEWEIYVTGAKSSSRLTTVVVIVTVKASGLIDAPLHVIPMSVAEQVDSKASQALLLAQAVKDAADAGKFNGKGFTIKGIYTSADELQSSVSEPDAGDMYGVGEAEPYDVYVWDGHGSAWVNLGPVRGVAGETGAAGTPFTPYGDTRHSRAEGRHGRSGGSRKEAIRRGGGGGVHRHGGDVLRGADGHAVPQRAAPAGRSRPHNREGREHR